MGEEPDVRRAKERSGAVVQRESGARCGEGGETMGMEVGAGDCASLAEECSSCSVQDCENIFCFREACAVAGDDWMAMAETALVIAKGEARKTRVKSRVEKSGDGKVGELHFGVAREFQEGLRGLLAVWKR